jgi:hypothetical protein
MVFSIFQIIVIPCAIYMVWFYPRELNRAVMEKKVSAEQVADRIMLVRSLGVLLLIINIGKFCWDNWRLVSR